MTSAARQPIIISCINLGVDTIWAHFVEKLELGNFKDTNRIKIIPMDETNRTLMPGKEKAMFQVPSKVFCSGDLLFWPVFCVLNSAMIFRYDLGLLLKMETQSLQQK